MSLGASQKAKNPDPLDFSWSKICSSSRREKAIFGAMMGIAVGEALGLARQKLNRRTGLWVFGRGPLRYRLVPGLGVAGFRLHATLQSGQAILKSYQKQAVFQKHLARRTKWYLLFSVATIPFRLWLSGLKLWIPLPAESQGVGGHDPELIPRSLLLSVALQGTAVSVDRWVEAAAKTTQSDPKVIEACTLLAYAAQIANFADPAEGIDAAESWKALSEEVVDEELVMLMKKLGPMLARRRSVQSSAKAMGWQNGIPSEPYPIVTMAIYSWLRNPQRFRRAVEPAILLGGDSATMGAIAGGLAAIHLTSKQIPPEWVGRLSSWPHGREWMKQLTTRLTDWPHGAEDLHRAPALHSSPFLQAIRNGLLAILLVVNRIVKLPFQLFSRSF